MKRKISLKDSYNSLPCVFTCKDAAYIIGVHIVTARHLISDMLDKNMIRLKETIDKGEKVFTKNMISMPYSDILSALPDTFTYKDFMAIIGCSSRKAITKTSYMKKAGMIERIGMCGKVSVYQKVDIKNKHQSVAAEKPVAKECSVIAALTDEFCSLSPQEKLAFAMVFIPELDKEAQDALLLMYRKAEECPPKFSHVKKGDSVFHPMYGRVVITEVVVMGKYGRIGFIAGGETKCVTMDGYDPDDDHMPVIFTDIDDYVDFMRFHDVCLLVKPDRGQECL